VGRFADSTVEASTVLSANLPT